MSDEAIRPTQATVTRKEALESLPVGAGTGTSRQHLTHPVPGSSFHMRRFIMEPGGGMPRHTNTVEHQQLVLRGRATIGLGPEEIQVQAGDVLHIPAGLPHWYRAEGDEAFEFLCAVPNEPDELRILGTEDESRDDPSQEPETGGGC